MTRLNLETLPSPANHGGWLTDWKGGRVRVARNQDNVFDIGLFHRGQWVDTSPWSTIKIDLKQIHGNVPPTSVQTPIATITVSFPGGTIARTDWEAGTAQHARVVLPEAQTAILLVGVTPVDLWLTIRLANTPNQQQVCAMAGRVRFVEAI